MAQFDATGGTVVQCGKQSTDTYTLGAINLSVSHCVTSTTYGRVYTATALKLLARKVSAMSSLAMDRRSCCKWQRKANTRISQVYKLHLTEYGCASTTAARALKRRRSLQARSVDGCGLSFSDMLLSTLVDACPLLGELVAATRQHGSIASAPECSHFDLLYAVDAEGLSGQQEKHHFPVSMALVH